MEDKKKTQENSVQEAFEKNLQENTNSQKNEGENKEKPSKVIDKNTAIKIIGVVAVALIVIILVIMLNKANIEKIAEESVANSNQATTAEENQGEVTTQEYSLIDMENTENAKIEDGKKENTSETLLKEKTFSGYKVSEIKLYTQDGATYFKAMVKNETTNKYDAKPISVKFLTKDGGEYAILETYIGDMPAGGEAHINASTTQDLANAYDFTISF